MPTVLAIETSCDETAIAIVRDRQVLGSVVASQIELHRKYGGVVPELASRQHLETVNFCLDEVFTQASTPWTDIDAIAATIAPGLVGALLVGTMTAKTLAVLHNKHFIGVHHLEGHIAAAYLSEPSLQPPFLCLLVSGGHTSLIHVHDVGRYECIGRTRDDAAGEAFDKVARLLKLGYPGGPVIDRLAQQGNPETFSLPEGRVSLPKGGFHRYDTSFSGLKTAVLRLVQKLEFEADELPINDIAASFQAAVAQALTKRVINAACDHNLSTIVVGGGVAANSGLRRALTTAAAARSWTVHFPPLKYCTDNAAMIGCAATERLRRGWVSRLELGVSSRLGIEKTNDLYNLEKS
ncbi:MAG: tRNA (adenosine(37)-N6)-threonylcarbamoyltransferase complex transferase subunit TsaD [Cyanobacteria bacterium P01_H01_bin.15]